MSAINVILLSIGLSMCLGGIYFRKLFAGLMGFCWSLTMGSLFLLLMLLSGDVETSLGILLVGIVVIACTAISVIYDRICVAINSFMGSFSILFLLALIMGDSENRTLWIIIAIVISLIPAGISYNFYNLAFILNTAFTGGLIASIGGYGLLSDFDSSAVGSMFSSRSSEFLTPVLIGTIVLGCIGTVVQIQKLNREINSISDESITNMSNSANINRNNLASIKSLYRNVIHSETMTDLCSEKLCLLIGLIGFVIFPLANDHMNWMETGLALFVNRAYFILETAAFAGVIYFAYNKKARSGIVYCIPYLIVRLIVDGSLMKYSMVIVLLKMVEPFIILFVSLLLNKVMKTDFKYWISILILIFYHYLLFRWVNLREVYWALTRGDIIPIVAVIVLTATIVYVRTKKNIFDIALFINQRAGKSLINNRMVMIAVVVLVVILAGTITLTNYVQEKKRYENSAAGQHENRTDEEINDMSDLPETDTNYFSGSSWEVLCMYDSNENEVSQHDILGDDFGTPFGISFYGEEWGYGGNMYGLYLGNGTNGEMDGQRWGEYSCENNVISIECDIHGDIFELEHTSVLYEGESYEALKLIETITDAYEYSEVYTIYFVNQFDFSDNNDNQQNEMDVETEEMISVLTAEPWEVYRAYDCYTEEDTYIGLIYSEMAVRRGINYLKFSDDGTFCFGLGTLTSDYDNGEMTGVYECSGNRVTLYSDSSTEVIEMEYTFYSDYYVEGMALQWIDDISDSTTSYRVYLVKPSFYQ